MACSETRWSDAANAANAAELVATVSEVHHEPAVEYELGVATSFGPCSPIVHIENAQDIPLPETGPIFDGRSLFTWFNRLLADSV